MGWTGVYSSPSKKDRKKWMDRELTSMNKDTGASWKVLRSCCRKFDSVYYAAVEKTSPGQPTIVFAVVALMKQHGAEFMYKAMDETMGPFQSDCPKYILSLLSPPLSENSKKWRDRQHVNQSKRRAT